MDQLESAVKNEKEYHQTILADFLSKPITNVNNLQPFYLDEPSVDELAEINSLIKSGSAIKPPQDEMSLFTEKHKDHCFTIEKGENMGELLFRCYDCDFNTTKHKNPTPHMSRILDYIHENLDEIQIFNNENMEEHLMKLLHELVLKMKKFIHEDKRKSKGDGFEAMPDYYVKGNFEKVQEDLNFFKRIFDREPSKQLTQEERNSLFYEYQQKVLGPRIRDIYNPHSPYLNEYETGLKVMFVIDVKKKKSKDGKYYF